MLKDSFGPIRAKEIEAELAELVDNLQVLGYKEVKPWGEFISSMKPPAQWDAKTIEQRISTNMLYYRSNYLVICATILAVNVLFSPLVILSLLVVAALMIYVKVFTRGVIVVGKMRLDETMQMKIAIGVSMLFLGLVGTLQTLLWVLLLSLVTCGAHMLFRARSISSKLNRAQEEIKLNMHHHTTSSGSPTAADGDGGAVSSFFSAAIATLSSKASAAEGSGAASAAAAADDVESAALRAKAGADGVDDVTPSPSTPYRQGTSGIGGVGGGTTSARKRGSPSTSSAAGSSAYGAGGRTPRNPKND